MKPERIGIWLQKIKASAEVIAATLEKLTRKWREGSQENDRQGEPGDQDRD